MVSLVPINCVTAPPVFAMPFSGCRFEAAFSDSGMEPESPPCQTAKPVYAAAISMG